MSTLLIAPPKNLQLQSALLSLPAEIKNIIYGLCFTAPSPIIDPSASSEEKSEQEASRELGVGLLQTCRRIYYEADRRPLFAKNRFYFSTVEHVRGFLDSLGPLNRKYVQDIEIDARGVHSDHPGIAREWLHYLTWGGGNWGKTLSSLRVDSPGLQCLRLNFESWPAVPMFRAELWNLLRSMLLQVQGLERVVVIGTSKGPRMASREPWSPVHFVGGDDVGSDDLVQRMGKAVLGNDNAKVIRWERRDEKIHLEVVTREHLLRHVDPRWPGPCTRKSCTDPWPANGSCTWFAYETRDSEAVERPWRELSPTASE